MEENKNMEVVENTEVVEEQKTEPEKPKKTPFFKKVWNGIKTGAKKTVETAKKHPVATAAIVTAIGIGVKSLLGHDDDDEEPEDVIENNDIETIDEVEEIEEIEEIGD